LRVRLVGGQGDVAAQALEQSRVVRAVGPGVARLLTLASLRRHQAKGAWIAHFKEVTTRAEAETLTGSSLFVREEQRPALPEGEFYVDELLGLEVETDTGQSLGRLAEVLHAPASDVYVTDTDVMVPAVAAFILRIDPEARKILVRDVPGLREGT
jgi:16S rRNA processing protein RimM